jgi:hypothetical protein
MKSWQAWIRCCTGNLVITAFLGCLLRYKILFPLPWVDQKFILHAHSHFAFAGWISLLLMVLMVQIIAPAAPTRFYRNILWLHLLSAYGMLLSFPFQGYGPVSIGFSTATVVISFVFAFRYWKDIEAVTSQTVPWFKAALFFHLLSSAGTFALSAMMATHTINQNAYLASVYFYLHFEYNGWFLFAVFGLFVHWINIQLGIWISSAAFRLFLISCIPAYVLSALWLPLPGWCYMIVVAASITQIIGWIRFTVAVFPAVLKTKPDRFTGIMLSLVFLALSIKLLLQFSSTWKPLGNLAYGFRPVVIGYLHLVLLGIITLFLLTYLYMNGSVSNRNFYRYGAGFFTAAVVLNEITLFIQGTSAILLTIIPYIQEILFGCAVLLFAGATGIWLSFIIQSKNQVYAVSATARPDTGIHRDT